MLDHLVSFHGWSAEDVQISLRSTVKSLAAPQPHPQPHHSRTDSITAPERQNRTFFCNHTFFCNRTVYVVVLQDAPVFTTIKIEEIRNENVFVVLRNM